ncbi:hypothetical protein [Ruminobacter sp.]|uniref:hypothetical protein n=1 Tax=Ruminobacter sp. TaxID=2774296 RepID=UPI003862EFB6
MALWVCHKELFNLLSVQIMQVALNLDLPDRYSVDVCHDGMDFLNQVKFRNKYGNKKQYPEDI